MEITLQPTPKQHKAYEALRDLNIAEVFLGGGAGGGKSWLICESRLINAIQYPGYKSFIGREELKRLMQSTYITWTKVCKYHKFSQDNWKLNGQYNFIELSNGSRIDLVDLKFLPSDPLYERFGSLEYTDGAIEEAGEVDFLAYDVLKSRLGRHRNEEFNLNPTLLITGNPKKNWTYREFYKPWKEKTLDPSKVFIQSLYTDNPHTADSYGKQLAAIKDIPTKRRLMYGEWEYEDDPTALIRYDAITDLFTNSVQKKDKYLTADIARFGKDKTVIMLWNGYECYRVITWEQQDIHTTALKLKEIASDEQIPYSQIVVDEDGVGGGVVDLLRGVKGFIANSRPIDNPQAQEAENFRNLKAQCAYKLADFINQHKLAVKNVDERIKQYITEDLEQIKAKDPDDDTRKRAIIPKDDVKELLGRSPDYGDNLIMRMYFELGNPFDSMVKYKQQRNFMINESRFHSESNR